MSDAAGGGGELRALLAFACELADLARGIALRHFRVLDAVDTKDDRTPVTAADRAIERALREAIAARHPSHGVLGEEEGADRAEASHLWVVDPIDGTKAFATGNPLFGTLIGLCRDGEPVVGVLDAPALRERWTGARGLGATHDGRPIRTRARHELSDAVAYCTTPEQCRDLPAFRALQRELRWTSFGGDCLAYGFVAMGGADLVVDRGLRLHDWCALAPILTEAGGALVDWQGRPLTPASAGDVVAAGRPELAEAAVRILVSGGA